MTTNKGSAQRREHARIAIRMSAEIRIPEAGEAGEAGEVDPERYRAFTATTRDLSEGGVGLEPERALQEGAELTLGLFLVIDDVEEEVVPPLWVKGRVAWVGEADGDVKIAGVRFEVITDEQKAWIRGVLHHISQANKSS